MTLEELIDLENLLRELTLPYLWVQNVVGIYDSASEQVLYHPADSELWPDAYIQANPKANWCHCSVLPLPHNPKACLSYMNG